VLKSYSSQLQVVEQSHSVAVLERACEELVSTSFPSGWSNSRTKRAFDVAVTVPAIFLALPALAAVAVAVKCSSPGPVLFRQSRAGKDQVPFTIYKFRTMREGKAESGSTVTVKGDARLTGIGKLLRRFKLDELPQLFNVLLGDMSMVGPRPKLAEHERMKLICRPGITGAATLVFSREEELLAGIRSDDVEQYTIQVLNPIKARLDTEYAETSNLISDLSILICTVFRLRPGSTPLDLPELSEVSPDFVFDN
jgi:lipopolysaccharide/colanic/teichoic acid biosynthesis glycosyltransferase